MTQGGAEVERAAGVAVGAAPAGGPLPGPAAADARAWAPLRRPAFRWLWLGVLVSGVGTWMQTVGALSVKLTQEEVAYLEEPYVPHPVVGHQ
jgi:hypothetical protein